MSDGEPGVSGSDARRGVNPVLLFLALLFLAFYAGERLLALGITDPVQRALLLGDVRGAEAAIQSRLRAQGESVDGLAEIGELLLKAGHPDRAVPYLERAVKRGPHSPVRLLLGTAFEQLGRDAEAEALYREAVRRNPDDPAALNYLGYFYAQRARNLDEAVSLLDRALERAPASAAIIDSMGWALYQRGDVAAARGHLLAAVNMLPNDAAVRFHLGVILVRDDPNDPTHRSRDRGKVELGKALILNPRMPDARAILQDVCAGKTPPLPVPWTRFRE